MSEIRRFLEPLSAGKPNGLYILLWTLPEKQSHWFTEVEKAIEFAESQRGRDLYVGVGFSAQDYGAMHRCKSDDVAGIVGLWADLDLKTDAHAKDALPATIEQALEILPEEFPPTFLIHTGNGIHAWWLLREPLIFDTEGERIDAAKLSSRWQTLLRTNAAARGWAFERLSDLARVLRIPGTQNRKDPQHPRPVLICSQSDRRYNPSDFTDLLDGQGIPDIENQQQTILATQHADDSLSIDPDAAVPDDLLKRHMAADQRFKSTWLRNREDMKDKSQSGYDLALAKFAVDAGWPEQQIVDLIIHHRRIHSEKPRTKIDYFQRTIAKALSGSVRAAATSPAHESNQPPHETKPDSAIARALLCEQVSNLIGVRVLRIIKIDGREPTYRIELETTRIVFASIEKLVRQQSFRMKIASGADHLIPKVSAKVWDQIVQLLLNALTIQDGGDEASLDGEGKMRLERYLSETRFIDSEGGQLFQQRFNPTVHEGRIAICASHLKEHIYKVGGENLASKDVAAMLSALGAESTRLKHAKLRDQSRWLLSPDSFPPDPARWEEA